MKRPCKRRPRMRSTKFNRQKKRNSEAVINHFVEWIAACLVYPPETRGAPAPRRTAFRITEEDRRHWAYQPVVAAVPPQVHDGRWCRSGVDRFVLAELEKRGLEPAGP